MSKRVDTNNKALETELRYLLGDLCREKGFCLRPEDVSRIAQARIMDADRFAAEVITAEGMKPAYEKAYFRIIRQEFVDRFGELVSSEDCKRN